MISELLSRSTGSTLLLYLTSILMVAAVFTALPRLGLREAYLIVLCAALVGLTFWLHPDAGSVVRGAFSQATFLMSFMLLLGLLHEAASTSPAISTCGRYLTRQPPSRRYYVLNIGTALMAVLFNMGVVSFLVPLIQGGIESATPGDPANPIRERRQMSAVLRGFAWCVLWSPTALAPLALLELIPGIQHQKWMIEGACIFLFMLVLGALEDRIRYRNHRPRPGQTAPEFPRAAFGRFVLACLWLLVMSYIVHVLSGDTIVFGLMVSCPFMLVGWLLTQYGGVNREAATKTVQRLKVVLVERLPRSSSVAVTLGCSGFVGSCASAIIPFDAWSNYLGLSTMPHFLFLSLLPITIAVLSLLALSPIMMAVFFGSLIGGLPVLPADPTLIALSISCGWGLSMTFSPFATVVLLMQRTGEIPGTTLTFRWNTVFTILAAVCLFPIFAFLTGGQ